MQFLFSGEKKKSRIHFLVAYSHVCSDVLMSRHAGPSCANNVSKCALAFAGDGNMAFSTLGRRLQTRQKIALVNEIGCGLRVTEGVRSNELE